MEICQLSQFFLHQHRLLLEEWAVVSGCHHRFHLFQRIGLASDGRTHQGILKDHIRSNPDRRGRVLLRRSLLRCEPGDPLPGDLQLMNKLLPQILQGVDHLGPAIFWQFEQCIGVGQRFQLGDADDQRRESSCRRGSIDGLQLGNRCQGKGPTSRIESVE